MCQKKNRAISLFLFNSKIDTSYISTHFLTFAILLLLVKICNTHQRKMIPNTLNLT